MSYAEIDWIVVFGSLTLLVISALILLRVVELRRQKRKNAGWRLMSITFAFLAHAAHVGWNLFLFLKGEGLNPLLPVYTVIMFLLGRVMFYVLFEFIFGPHATTYVLLEALEKEQPRLRGWGKYRGLSGVRTKYHFANSHAHLYYGFSDLARGKKEVIAFCVAGHQCGFEITFVDDEITKWKHYGGKANVSLMTLNSADMVSAHKVLEEARRICQREKGATA